MNEVDELLVCLRCDLADVPDLPLPAGVEVRTMDPDDPADVRRWLEVHNAAFGRAWDEENHRLAMIENPVVVVDRTYLAEQAGEVVATASIGRFRRNPDVGLGHYLAVHPSSRGLGLATAMSSLRYRVLAEQVAVAEAQTHLHRVGSLRAHFACGFRPKAGVDEWNSLDPTDGPLRVEADRRLNALYDAWRAGR